MAKKKTKAASSAPKAAGDMTPMVAAELAGVVYRAKLANRTAKLNISEEEVVTEVIRLYRTIHGRLTKG